MGIRALAEEDLASTLEDASKGFGWPILLTSPDSASFTFNASVTDTSSSIDPDTGQVVSGRTASATVRLSSLYDVGFTIPRGITDTSIKPWIVDFDDINGIPYSFKVAQSYPDRVLGIVVLLLETYSE